MTLSCIRRCLQSTTSNAPSTSMFGKTLTSGAARLLWWVELFPFREFTVNLFSARLGRRHHRSIDHVWSATWSLSGARYSTANILSTSVGRHYRRLPAQLHRVSDSLPGGQRSRSDCDDGKSDIHSGWVQLALIANCYMHKSTAANRYRWQWIAVNWAKKISTLVASFSRPLIR